MQEEAVESFFLHFYEYSLTDSGICPGTSYLPFTAFLLNTFVLIRCIENADFSETFWTTLVIEIVLSKWLISMLDSTDDRNKGVSVWNIIKHPLSRFRR